MCNITVALSSSKEPKNSSDEMAKAGDYTRINKIAKNSDDEREYAVHSTRPSIEKKSFIDSLEPTPQFIFLTVFMFVFFGLHNVLQEAMVKIPDFKFGVMLGYMEVLGVTIFSFIERTFVAKESGHKAPLKAYPLLTLCLLSSSALSNMSLNYINFPTKVVFRSCKLVPTMIIATIINKRVFSSLEYFCGFAVCAGLVFFAAADWKLTPSFNPFGLILVSISVIADSILPNAQEKLFVNGSSRLEVTFYSNFFTLVAMTVTTLMSGDLIGLLKLATSDASLTLYMVVYTMVAYVAISFFMQIVKRFGAVTGVLVATARKGMTLIISFLIFPKAFSWFYVFGATLVLGGLLSSSLIKLSKKTSKTAGVEIMQVNASKESSSEMESLLVDSNTTLMTDEKKDEEMGR